MSSKFRQINFNSEEDATKNSNHFKYFNSYDMTTGL